jgi:hypothetical protein
LVLPAGATCHGFLNSLPYICHCKSGGGVSVGIGVTPGVTGVVTVPVGVAVVVLSVTMSASRALIDPLVCTRRTLCGPEGSTGLFQRYAKPIFSVPMKKIHFSVFRRVKNKWTKLYALLPNSLIDIDSNPIKQVMKTNPTNERKCFTNNTLNAGMKGVILSILEMILDVFSLGSKTSLYTSITLSLIRLLSFFTE